MIVFGKQTNPFPLVNTPQITNKPDVAPSCVVSFIGGVREGGGGI